MNKAFILVLAIMLGIFGFALAQETKTIKGEVIDVSCYAAAGAKGMDHKTCAIACIQAGEPAGVLEEKTGKVYVVITQDHTNPAKKIMPYISKMVEVTGTVNERGGVSVIDIKEIKEMMGQSESMPKQGMGMMKEKK